MYKSVIKGIGHYVPDNVVTNDDLAKIMDTNDEWITERTGIKDSKRYRLYYFCDTQPRLLFPWMWGSFAGNAEL